MVAVFQAVALEAAVGERGKEIFKSVKEFIKRETILTLVSLFALCSFLFTPPSSKTLSFIDFKVLGALFILMAVINGFRSLGVFELLAHFLISKSKNYRTLILVLIALPFCFSFLITNDVALLTFVPLTLVVFSHLKEKKNLILTVVLQTVAANIGSCLTPMGNPQNLFLYSFYDYSPLDFIFTMAPLFIMGALSLLALSIFKFPATKINLQIDTVGNFIFSGKKLTLYSVLFLVGLASIFDLIWWPIGLIATLIFIERKILFKVDYSLLFTFVAFFIFVGNLEAIESIKNLLFKIIEGRVFLTAILTSQVISNVPAAVLLSNFTNEANLLLLGVNVGGCGTLIASLASVISYKIFVAYDRNQRGSYLKVFTLVNFSLLLIFILFIWIVAL